MTEISDSSTIPGKNFIGDVDRVVVEELADEVTQIALLQYYRVTGNKNPSPEVVLEIAKTSVVACLPLAGLITRLQAGGEQ
ncbi:hypothetical protein [Leptolyngbya sp. CCY15150]|uniref:hypothetical protein n=1 Tax=Leptolyngbya sp. CCY15150 TaxID=2767772 RepID=UPI00195012D6|nr:hypothetical protein [Leptolyngbya sp. CCY15150]